MREMASVPARAVHLLWFEETPNAWYGGGGGDPPALEEALAKVAAIEKAHGVTVHVLDPRAVCGPAHLAAALLHARRARDRGRPHARDPKVELMVYLAGSRQIARAIEAAGLRPGGHGVAFAIEGGAQAAWNAHVDLLHALGISRSDEVLAASAAKAKAIGVSGKAEDEAGWESLAIEKVAALDLG